MYVFKDRNFYIYKGTYSYALFKKVCTICTRMDVCKYVYEYAFAYMYTRTYMRTPIHFDFVYACASYIAWV